MLMRPVVKIVKRARSKTLNTRMDPLMSLYRDTVLPWLTHLAMRQAQLVPYRTRVASGATGRVLEIGIGPGLNLPFYGPTVKQVIGLDPSPRLLDIALDAGQKTNAPLAPVKGTAEAPPSRNKTVVTVVATWAMCSLADLNHTRSVARRVVKRDGKLLF